MTGSFRLRIGIISVVIGGHFGGGDHFDGGDHFGGGTEPILNWSKIRTYIWKHILGVKTLSLKTFQKKKRTKRTSRWRCAPFWKRNWILATLLMLKYSEFIVYEKREEKFPDPYLLDSYDIRTVKSFFRWDIVYEEQTVQNVPRSSIWDRRT